MAFETEHQYDLHALSCVGALQGKAYDFYVTYGSGELEKIREILLACDSKGKFPVKGLGLGLPREINTGQVIRGTYIITKGDLHVVSKDAI